MIQNEQIFEKLGSLDSKIDNIVDDVKDMKDKITKMNDIIVQTGKDQVSTDWRLKNLENRNVSNTEKFRFYVLAGASLFASVIAILSTFRVGI